MHIEPSQTPELLNRLRKLNDIRQPELNARFGLNSITGRSQFIEPPLPIDRGIPTLAANVYKRASAMLRYRFEYAAAWNDALFGIRFLSIQEMEAIWSNQAILQQVRIRQETWPDSPPATVSWDQISLFGINPFDGEEIYLVWAPTGTYPESDEPEVIEYIANDDNHFRSLGDFIYYHCQAPL